MKMYLSKKGKLLLEDRLYEIEKEITETYRLMGESTKVDNDLRENPEYLELQTKVSYKLPLEKSKIKETLTNACIIEEQDFYKEFDGSEVIIGSKVSLLYDNQKEVFYIVGEAQEDPFNNIISYNCDFATNLLGKKINSEFKYKNSTIRIEKIERI